MKACVKAWQAVISPATGKVHDEVGFRALDALLFMARSEKWMT